MPMCTILPKYTKLTIKREELSMNMMDLVSSGNSQVCKVTRFSMELPTTRKMTSL